MAKGAKAWVWLLLLTLLLLAFAWPRSGLQRLAREGIFPLENGAAWVNYRVWRPLGRLWRAALVDQRNAVLEAEVERLRLDAILLEPIARENEELRRRLQLPARSTAYPLPALVVSEGGATGWLREVRISRGSRDGVAEGDGVMTPDGLVGRVSEVSHETSAVRLITDPNSRIACRLDPIDPETGVIRGILQGAGWRTSSGNLPALLHVIEPLKLRYIERDVVLPPRMLVVTAGLGESLPGGLPVGYLLASEIDAEGLYRVGEVVPAADLAQLAVLYVLIQGGER